MSINCSWFSKNLKVSKKQYDDARKSDDFKVFSRESWDDAVKIIEEIYRQYTHAVCVETKSLNYAWGRFIYTFNGFSNEWNEYQYFRKVKSYLDLIDGGWYFGKTTETVYITNDLKESNLNDNFTFKELDNGDLLVTEQHITKKSIGKTIEEIRNKRYTCGSWKKKIITIDYKKNLLQNHELLQLQLIEGMCDDYEILSGEKLDGNT